MLTRMPVLIVDDEESALEAMSAFLEEEGYDVHLATDGEKALNLLKIIKPDMVVTDLCMPGISGIELIRQIRILNLDMPILVMTAYGSLESAVDAIRLDVYDFVFKPLDINYLKNTMSKARINLAMVRAMRVENNFLREQLALAQTHLDAYHQTMTEVKSLALAARVLTEVLRHVDSRLAHVTYQADILEILRMEVKDLQGIKKEAVCMDQIVRAILTRIKSS